jgi:hypothetical protein
MFFCIFCTIPTELCNFPLSLPSSFANCYIHSSTYFLNDYGFNSLSGLKTSPVSMVFLSSVMPPRLGLICFSSFWSCFILRKLWTLKNILMRENKLTLRLTLLRVFSLLRGKELWSNACYVISLDNILLMHIRDYQYHFLGSKVWNLFQLLFK